ncbi:unnamed protein product [Ranitomeya imitator]|uniref:Uncharacterized protein n=1 Tax=Ranitomeya imitator TaxID=111125 RepID=A0ABN9MRE1_9NEOB|nr:unnamed protein product [Ranitomeya imitator]
MQNGDGCSQKCQLEENYICRGNPSLCYIPNEDNEFVDDDIEMSAECEEPTSQGYNDLWASHAAASHEDLKNCPVSAVIGEPIQKVILLKNNITLVSFLGIMHMDI